ncbi:MAG: YbaB/EbfC family nucleoid-associated protein [Patescibacteria group bacterium]|jgi:DNA-binding protein YbaB
MLDQFKQLKTLRDQAKALQDALAEKSITVQKNGVSLTLDGNQKVTNLTIPPELTPVELEKIIPTLINDANDKVKRIMAETMQSLGGFNFPGM